jgi:hypothetical protein
MFAFNFVAGIFSLNPVDDALRNKRMIEREIMNELKILVGKFAFC